MRTLMKVIVPTDAGSKAIKDGTLPKVIGETIERIHPEAAYFGMEGGKRTAFFVFDLKDATQLPGICEPIFMGLGAAIEVSPIMNGADLKAGLDAWQRQG